MGLARQRLAPVMQPICGSRSQRLRPLESDGLPQPKQLIPQVPVFLFESQAFLPPAVQLSRGCLDLSVSFLGFYDTSLAGIWTMEIVGEELERSTSEGIKIEWGTPLHVVTLCAPCYRTHST